MASITKTQGIEVIETTQLIAGTVLVSDVQDVTTKLAATIFIHLAKIDPNALTTGCEIRIEASAKASGDDQWFPIQTFKSTIAAAVSENLTGTNNSGDTVLEMVSTTGFSAGQLIFIESSPLFESSEWARIASVTLNTSVTLVDELTLTQTGSEIWSGAEMYVAQLDLSAIGRIRVVADASNTGRNVGVQVYMVTGDTIG